MRWILGIILLAILVMALRHYLVMRSSLRRASRDPFFANGSRHSWRPDLVHTEKMAHIGTLSAGVAHEINTPLGSAICAGTTGESARAKLLEALDGAHPGILDDPEIRKLLKTLDESDQILSLALERVKALVDRLGEMSREESFEPVPADLHRSLDGSLLLLRNRLKHRIEVIRDYGEIPEVVCYPSALDQVFLNLLVNAARAIEDQGRITIATVLAGDRVEVRISDTGRGIPESERDAIFDFGFTTHAETGGTGLGLPISRRIMEKHKGRLELERTSDEGTTFRVDLPLDLREIPDAGPGPVRRGSA